MRGSGGYTSQDGRPHLTLSGGTMSSRERHSPPVRRVGGRQESSLFGALPLFGVDSKITIAARRLTTTGLHMPCIVSDSAWASSRSDAPQPSFVNLWVKHGPPCVDQRLPFHCRQKKKADRNDRMVRPSNVHPGRGEGKRLFRHLQGGRKRRVPPEEGKKSCARARTHTRRRWADGLRHSTF